jgi:CBS-domain-containing membrane protein
LVLEDAMAQMLSSVSDFMVREPVAVEWWQPVSLARQKLLEHSFTYLPVIPDDGSEVRLLVADHHLARFLGPVGGEGRLDRLGAQIGHVIQSGELETAEARTVRPEMSVFEVISRMGDHPLLVTDGDRLLGIITAFDVL